MRQWIMIAVVLVASWPGLSVAQDGATSPADCRNWGYYWLDMRDAIPDRDPAMQASLVSVFGNTADQYRHADNTDLLAMSGYLREYRAKLDAIEAVPSVLGVLHNQYMSRILIYQQLVREAVFGNHAQAFYLDQLATNMVAITATADHLHKMCGDTWIDFASQQPDIYWMMWQGWFGSD